MAQRVTSVFTLLAIFLAGVPAGADAFEATLTLDGMSFVSFGDREVLPLPAGSTLVLRFASDAAERRVPFTIVPSDVDIAPIPLGDGRSLRYGLAGPAKGVMRLANGERVLEFSGEITATLSGSARSSGTFTYTMPFTTESASATDLAGTGHVQVAGARVPPGVTYVQLVGATVNKANAFPEPGAAVYTVLSGSFDRLPALAP